MEHWPLNPLDVMIEYAKKLPDGSVVADMGCGEARLARTLKELKKNVTVRSFDLVAGNEFITACDIRKVRLLVDASKDSRSRFQ